MRKSMTFHQLSHVRFGFSKRRRRPSMLHRTHRVQLITLLAFALALAPQGARTILADDARCFPETGQCISGRFRSFWEENGGLAVFGYPIAAPSPEINRDDDQLY